MENKVYIIKGIYTLRQIAGEYLAIPISNEAGDDANIVILNPVSQIIWGKLETGATFDEILQAVCLMLQPAHPFSFPMNLSASMINRW